MARARSHRSCWRLAGSRPLAQPPSAAELAAALQRKYGTVRDFSADFVQTYRGGVLNRQMKDSGRVMVRKPGMMRWEYKAPEEKLFVSDGSRVYWYIPQDKQVQIGDVPTDDRPPRPRCFWQEKAISRATSRPRWSSRPRGIPQGAQALKLVPHHTSGRVPIGLSSSSTRGPWRCEAWSPAIRREAPRASPSRT